MYIMAAVLLTLVALAYVPGAIRKGLLKMFRS